MRPSHTEQETRPSRNPQEPIMKAILNAHFRIAQTFACKKNYSDKWDNTGILNDLFNNKEKQNPRLLTIGDCIDKTNTLASLKYDFQNQSSLNWNYYEYNTKAVLAYSNISDYLIAYAFFVKGITEVNGLINFVRSHKEGVSNIVSYAVVSAARDTIQSESLNIPEASGRER